MVDMSNYGGEKSSFLALFEGCFSYQLIKVVGPIIQQPPDETQLQSVHYVILSMSA